MAIDLEKDTGLDPTLPENQGFLENLQSNILKGHGRDFAVYIFFTFKPPLDKVKNCIQILATNNSLRVTSTKDQLQAIEGTFLENLDKVSVNFFLSRKGYEALG